MFKSKTTSFQYFSNKPKKNIPTKTPFDGFTANLRPLHNNNVVKVYIVKGSQI